jgi:hypothetical protein
MIPSLSEIRSLLSSYHVRSCYRQTLLLILMTLHSRDIVTRLQDFIDAMVIKWAQSINPSRG